MAKTQCIGWSKSEARIYLGKSVWEMFEKWFLGQTGPLDRSGRMRYYEHDVKRFAEALKIGNTSFD